MFYEGQLILKRVDVNVSYPSIMALFSSNVLESETFVIAVKQTGVLDCIALRRAKGIYKRSSISVVSSLFHAFYVFLCIPCGPVLPVNTLVYATSPTLCDAALLN